MAHELIALEMSKVYGQAAEIEERMQALRKDKVMTMDEALAWKAARDKELMPLVERLIMLREALCHRGTA